MPPLSSNSRSSSSEDSPAQGVPAKLKTKFCMYHLQGVCKFAAGGCAYAHSTEEMRMGRTRKGRRGRGPPTGAASASTAASEGSMGSSNTFGRGVSESSGAAQSGHYDPLNAAVQPAYLSQEYLAAALAQQWHGTPIPFGHAAPGAYQHATTSLGPPPGLESALFPQSSRHAPALPPPLPMGLTYQPQGPYLAELSLNMADLAQLSRRHAASSATTMADWAHAASGDEPPMELGTSAADLSLLTNLVHNLQHALLMTSPNMGEQRYIGERVRDNLSSSPPGLTLPA